MASTSKAFRKCVDPCPRYLTPIDTHDCCVFCLGEEHARNVLEVAELRRTTDLALRATKQAATAMGRSMAAMVVTERHLWVNLADLEKKEKGFLLDAPISPPSFSVPQSRRWLRSLGRRERAQRPSKPSFQEGPGPSPNKAEVLARPGLRIGDGTEG